MPNFQRRGGGKKSTFVLKPGSGGIFPRDKENEKSPDYTGTIRLDESIFDAIEAGEDTFFISGWTNEDTGRIGLKIQTQREKGEGVKKYEQRTGQRSQERDKPYNPPFDDDLPEPPTRRGTRQ